MSVQKLRLQRGWSQEQLAQVSGVSARTIQRIERGQTPSLETLKALAAVFDVDLAQLRTPTMTDEALAAAPAPVAPGWSPQEMLAFARVRRLRAFYRHALIYALVVGGAAVAAVARTGSLRWVPVMAAGWGVGLLVHALAVFEKLPFGGADWEKRQVEKILGRKL